MKKENTGGISRFYVDIWNSRLSKRCKKFRRRLYFKASKE